MISIHTPKDAPKPPPNKLKLEKEVWTALWYLSLELKTTPEELITRWVNKRIELMEKMAREEEAKQEEQNKIIL